MPAKPRAIVLLPYDSSHQRNTSCRGEQRNPVPRGPLLCAHPGHPSLGLEGCRSALLWHWARIRSHPAEGHVGVCVCTHACVCMSGWLCFIRRISGKGKVRGRLSLSWCRRCLWLVSRNGKFSSLAVFKGRDHAFCGHSTLYRSGWYRA